MSQELDDDALVALPCRRELDWSPVRDGQHRRAGQPLVSRQSLAGAQGRHEETRSSHGCTKVRAHYWAHPLRVTTLYKHVQHAPRLQKAELSGLLVSYVL